MGSDAVSAGFGEAELRGERLAGADLDDAGLAAWLAAEERGFVTLAGPRPGPVVPNAAALNWWHALRHLGPRRFRTCLALGPARGADYLALAERVERFVAIEPAREWWGETIGGTPAEFRPPTLRGATGLPDRSVELAGCFSVLHHIPNVGEVIGELGRVLAAGGWLVVREPIVSMGDFRRPRPGLTAHERGIPHAMMDGFLCDAGLTIVRKSLCQTPGPFQLARRLGVTRPNDTRWFVILDALISRALAWNTRYWRPRLWQKAAPTMGFWVARKP